MKKSFLHKFWAGDEEYDEKREKKEEEIPKDPQTPLWLLILIGLIALLPRLYFVFFVSDPQNAGAGWYGDTYHHWQIAYLSKTVGFHEGFLRLWDFKGMEYYWGLLHPLVLAFLFTVTGSVSIIIPRLLSVAGGVAVVILIFLLTRRYFNLQVALSASLLAIFNPVGLFSDTVGMQEQLGLPLLFLGIWFWPKKPLLTGVFFALAAMVRAEYWLFGAGLLLLILILERKFDRQLLLLVSWGVLIFWYVRYLSAHTGNLIYPIWWNYKGAAAGEWMKDVEPTLAQIKVIWASRVVFAVTALSIFFTIWKKPRYWLLFLLGLGNILFMAYMFGFSDYVLGFFNRLYFDRLLNWPYLFLGILLSVALFAWLPKRLPFLKKPILSWVIVLAVIVSAQLAWKPILHYYRIGASAWAMEKQLSANVARFYQGGTLALKEDDPYLTYLLVYKYGLKGPNFLSQMYDPFYYATFDPWSDWGRFRVQIYNWFYKHDIRLLAFAPGKENYLKMIEHEPALFKKLHTDNFIAIYQVTPPTQEEMEKLEKEALQYE